MATSERTFKSTMNDSEEIFDLCCSTCADNGRNKEAKKYCRDCAKYFCDECLKFHSMFPALQNHAITDTTGLDLQSRTNVLSKEELPTCQVHHGQTVQKFCRDHREICCQTCIAAKHRTCKKLVEISDAAKNVRNSTDYATRQSALTDVLDSLKKEKNKKTKNLEDLKKAKENLLQDIETYREELIGTINNLAEKSKQEVTLKCADIETTTKTDISTIDTIIASTIKTLQTLTAGSEIQAFTHSRTCVTVIEEGQHLAQDMKNQKENRGLEYSLNKQVITGLKNFETLLIHNDIEEHVKEYTAKIDRKFPLFTNKCTITGILILDDEKILTANYSEQRLITYDQHFKEDGRVTIPGNPYAVCQTGPDEVLTCAGNTVYAVTLNRILTCEPSIEVGSQCSGVAYIPNKKEIVISCLSLLKVYSQESKTFIRSIEKDSTGAAIFSEAHFCSFNASMNLLFVSDKKGLIALNEAGQVQWVFSDQELQNPWGVCSLPGDILLVSGFSANSKIIQLNKAGKKISTLVDCIQHPFSLAYDVKKSRLLVGCHSKELQVYNISKH